MPREALPPLDTPATKPPGFIGCFPTEKKQHESHDAHSAFSLPKRTPSPLKTPVKETKVSLNSSCQTEAVFLVLGNCVSLIIRSTFDKNDKNDYNDYTDD